MGDSIDIAGSTSGDMLQVTVVKLVDPDAPANQFEQVPSGDHYVSVQFRILNMGTGTYQDDPLSDISVKDSAGQDLHIDFVGGDTAAGPQMPSSLNLVSGDKALGYVTFDVPNGDKIATVQYVLNGGLNGNGGQWKVS